MGRSVLLRYSAYYQHAARCTPAQGRECVFPPSFVLLPLPMPIAWWCRSFGNPPACIALDFGHRAVTLLARALRSGIVELGPAALPHLLQAAAYLQVGAATLLLPASWRPAPLMLQVMLWGGAVLLRAAAAVVITLPSLQCKLPPACCRCRWRRCWKQLPATCRTTSWTAFHAPCCEWRWICSLHHWPNTSSATFCRWGGGGGKHAPAALLSCFLGGTACVTCCPRRSPPSPFQSLQSFFMLSGAKAAEMLAEWPPAKRRELLCSCQLCAPTECCVVEVGRGARPLAGTPASRCCFMQHLLPGLQQA